ncbi:hypothetical protein [Staphylococcus xylosus]|uniref:hypothetical protein n=1 Tax=Staphylococcus xylosus TaxID=1288 RepID=UPI000853B690|nr:hypothetical protein [Staphylococcus xylosus]OEK78153.1 hypothetical protein AST16_09255 [Staphylococcus xylosus]
MKFFAGFITSVVIIALTLTGVYAYKELKPVDKGRPQQIEKVEDSAATQQMNQSTETQEQPQQTAPATIPSHEQQEQDSTQSIKQGKSDIQYIQGQYDGLKQHLKERASQGAGADELHEIQSQIDEYAIQHAKEINFD